MATVAFLRTPSSANYLNGVFVTIVSSTDHALFSDESLGNLRAADMRLGRHQAQCQPSGRSRHRSHERESAAIRVRELTVKGINNLSFDAKPGSLTALAGDPQTCATALLAISSHLPRDAGQIHIHGEPLPREPERARKLIAVARARPDIELDVTLRVGDLCAERRSRNVPQVVLDALFAALGLLGVRAPTDKIVAELEPADQLLLAVALVTARAPHVVVIDNVDENLGTKAAERVWLALRRLTRTGITVLTSANKSTVHVDSLVAV